MRFALVVIAVTAAGLAAIARHRSLHGARFLEGTYLDAPLRAPEHLGSPRSTERYTVPFALSPGSGSLAVRFETAVFDRDARAITRVVVEPDRVADGVTAAVTLTGYSATTQDGAISRPVAHVVLECVETAADGDHIHHLQIVADGTFADPDAAPSPPPPVQPRTEIERCDHEIERCDREIKRFKRSSECPLGSGERTNRSSDPYQSLTARFEKHVTEVNAPTGQQAWRGAPQDASGSPPPPS